MAVLAISFPWWTGNHPMFEFLALSRQSRYRTVLCSQMSGRKSKLEDTDKSLPKMTSGKVIRRSQRLTVQRSTLISRARLP